VAKIDDDPRRKIQILFWVDPSVDAKFRELIQKKYKKYELKE